MTYIDTCRQRIAALDGTELTPAQRGELRAMAGSRHLPTDVAAAAAALIEPQDDGGAPAAFERGRRAARTASAASATYPILED